jgi:hypothetical protein
MVATMKIAVLAGDRRCFVVAEVLHALFGLEVVLDPEALAAGVDPREPDCRSRSYAATCAGSRGQTSGWSPGGALSGDSVQKSHIASFERSPVSASASGSG